MIKLEKEPYLLTVDELSVAFQTDLKAGLTSEEVSTRLAEYGPNALTAKKGPSPWLLFFSQFNNFIIWVLIGAAAISGLLQEWIDTIAILAIVVLNAILGFIQEYKAEKSLEALKNLSVPMTKVYRQGRLVSLPSRDLVPGDLISLEAGDSIPADARLVSAFNVSSQEASLTGESTPVSKNLDVLMKETSLADRKNMVYQGTTVASGKGTAVVVATGMKTELGKIATLIQTTGVEVTPLQRRLEKLGKILVFVCLLIIALVFGLGLFQGAPLLEMFMTAVSLAVAAIPEGLPAVVTISLAFGVKKMVKRHALIRKLPSVETLGCATVICSDKTGTLTQNQMTVQKIWTGDHLIEVSGVGYEPKGTLLFEGKELELEAQSAVQELLQAGILCNDATLQESEGVWDIIGDPTEGAILTVGKKGGEDREALESEYELLEELPFDSDRKMMSVLRQDTEDVTAFVKGAPDVVLSCCSQIQKNGTAISLQEKEQKEILEMNEQLAGQALRVIALAKRTYPSLPKDVSPEHVEQELTFLGLVAMIDPPRPEAKAAVQVCREAGIHSVMITGDHKSTAIAIARELGLLEEGMEALTGKDLDDISDVDLVQRVEKVAVYARVTAEHKMRIVKAWQLRGDIVAMTGDGVNDAPAIKQANIGVGMGITGTDITKEVSDMVVTDDNFASIVNAIEEGRGIYDNIKKFVNFLLLCNLAEVMVIALALFFNFHGAGGELILPLVAIQILWMNLVTDGLPAIAMGVDPVNPHVMKRPPRQKNEKILSLDVALNIFIGAILICGATLFAFYWGLEKSVDLARTMAFTTLVMLQLTCVQMIRSLYSISIFSNRFLLLAIASSILLQLVVIYTPLNIAFRTVPIGWTEWGLIGGLSLLVFVLGKGLFSLIARLTPQPA